MRWSLPSGRSFSETDSPESFRDNPCQVMESHVKLSSPLAPILIFLAFTLVAVALHARGLAAPMYYDSEYFLEEHKATFSQGDLLKVIEIFPQRPLTMTTFYWNYVVWGMEPSRFRLCNIVVLGASGTIIVLLVFLLLKLVGWHERLRTAETASVSVLAGLFFTVHPFQTWVTLYIWQRSALLACLFSLSSLLAYLAVRSGKLSNKSLGYCSALVLFACAMLSKENSVALIGVLVIAEVAFFDRSPAIVLKRITSLVLVGGAFILLLSFLERPHGDLQLGIGIFNTIARYYEDARVSFLSVPLTQCRMVFLYIFGIIIPLPSTVQLIAPQVLSTSLFDPPETAIAVAGTVLLVSAGMYFLVKRPLCGFGILFFLVTMIPESFLVPQHAYFGYRAVLPMFGILVVAADCLLILLAATRKTGAASQTLRVALIGSIALGLGMTCAVTVGKAEQWRDPIRFWGEIVEGFPEDERHVERMIRVQTLLNLGRVFLRQQKLSQALICYEEAVRIIPESWRAHNNIGVVYLRSGNFQEAAKHFRKALEIKPSEPPIQRNLEVALQGIEQKRNQPPDDAGR